MIEQTGFLQDYLRDRGSTRLRSYEVTNSETGLAEDRPRPADPAPPRPPKPVDRALAEPRLADRVELARLDRELNAGASGAELERAGSPPESPPRKKGPAPRQKKYLHIEKRLATLHNKRTYDEVVDNQHSQMIDCLLLHKGAQWPGRSEAADRDDSKLKRKAAALEKLIQSSSRFTLDPKTQPDSSVSSLHSEERPPKTPPGAPQPKHSLGPPIQVEKPPGAGSPARRVTFAEPQARPSVVRRRLGLSGEFLKYEIDSKLIHPIQEQEMMKIEDENVRNNWQLAVNHSLFQEEKLLAVVRSGVRNKPFDADSLVHLFEALQNADHDQQLEDTRRASSILNFGFMRCITDYFKKISLFSMSIYDLSNRRCLRLMCKPSVLSHSIFIDDVGMWLRQDLEVHSLAEILRLFTDHKTHMVAVVFAVGPAHPEHRPLGPAFGRQRVQVLRALPQPQVADPLPGDERRSLESNLGLPLRHAVPRRVPQVGRAQIRLAQGAAELRLLRA